MKTEELAKWVDMQVPLVGEYQEDDPDHLPAVAERLRELSAEVERLKAHTWEQERSAVVAMLLNPNAPLRSSMHYAGKIQRGEHWSKGETP